MTTATITQKQQDVLDVVRASPAGMTDHEIGVALGLNLATANNRRVRLHRAGLLEYCGSQDTGAAIKRTIWRCTDG
jgi:DNA-binding IclR family transcriptional regulator